MKKLLFASAFELFGICGFAQEQEGDPENKRICANVANSCNIALMICWRGTIDPSDLAAAAIRACEQNTEEESAPDEGGN